MDTKSAQEYPGTNKHDPIMIAVVLFFTTIGLAVRLAAPLQASFPLNDGGLFYAMIVDLQNAQYALPVFATYNSIRIPFAYPPLAFYLTGLLADASRISVIQLIRVLPALISALTIPAFYSFAREVTASKIQIIFGVFAFALLPRNFAWLIMGGGITRSFGLLFSIITMTYIHRFYTGHKMRPLLACILFGALTVVTHPEACVHTGITALIFYLWNDRSLNGFRFSFAIAAGIIVLTSPWWGLILSRHGVDPFLAAFNASRQDSINPFIGLFIFYRFLFTDEPFLPILGLLGLVGLFSSLARKQTLLPGWLFLLHLIEPRGGTLYMMIPLALLIGHALEKVILPALNPRSNNAPSDVRQALENILRGKVARYFLLFVFAYSTMSAYNTSLKIKQDLSLHPGDMDAFDWVRENTPQDSEFLLVTAQLPLRDAWTEWFPVLTERHSQATVFGYEWVNDGRFGSRVVAYKNLQSCAYKDSICLEEWDQRSNEPFDYVYLYHRSDPSRYPLTIRLELDENYELVFQNPQTMVFQISR